MAELLAAERLARGTRPGDRALSCEKQALFALVWFRERRDVVLIGEGLGISQATAYRIPMQPSTCSPPAPPTCTTR